MKRDKATGFIEPFSHDLDLWTVGVKGQGFVWLLAPANTEQPRCRTVPRREGVTQLRTTMWTEAEDCRIVLGGGAGGNEIAFEMCNLSLTLDSRPSRNGVTG